MHVRFGDSAARVSGQAGLGTETVVTGTTASAGTVTLSIVTPGSLPWLRPERRHQTWSPAVNALKLLPAPKRSLIAPLVEIVPNVEKPVAGSWRRK